MDQTEQHRRRDRTKQQRLGHNLGCHTLPDKFTQLPNVLFGLPAPAIVVWLVIKSHDFGEFAYFLSYEQIAREAGISKSGTQCWVAWLIERGLVKIDHHGDEREGEGHAYIALSPSRPIVRVTMDPWSK